jgi:hypothetical protein
MFSNQTYALCGNITLIKSIATNNYLTDFTCLMYLGNSLTVERRFHTILLFCWIFQENANSSKVIYLTGL